MYQVRVGNQLVEGRKPRGPLWPPGYPSQPIFKKIPESKALTYNEIAEKFGFFKQDESKMDPSLLGAVIAKRILSELRQEFKQK